MKKILGLLVGCILLGSCFRGTVIDAPYIVSSVEKITRSDLSGGKRYKIVATFRENKVEYYTDTIYTVGDTLRMK